MLLDLGRRSWHFAGPVVVVQQLEPWAVRLNKSVSPGVLHRRHYVDGVEFSPG